jgi:hypothetical protein
MSMNKAAILVLLTAQILACGGCAHKAERREDAAAAREAQAAENADAKRFQEMMDMLYKMKPAAHESESAPGDDNGVFAPAPATTNKATETPKVKPQQESGDRK